MLYIMTRIMHVYRLVVVAEWSGAFFFNPNIVGWIPLRNRLLSLSSPLGVLILYCLKNGFSETERWWSLTVPSNRLRLWGILHNGLKSTKTKQTINQPTNQKIPPWKKKGEVNGDFLVGYEREQTSVDQQSHINQQPAIDCSLTRSRFCEFWLF